MALLHWPVPSVYMLDSFDKTLLWMVGWWVRVWFQTIIQISSVCSIHLTKHFFWDDGGSSGKLVAYLEKTRLVNLLRYRVVLIGKHRMGMAWFPRRIVVWTSADVRWRRSCCAGNGSAKQACLSHLWRIDAVFPSFWTDLDTFCVSRSYCSSSIFASEPSSASDWEYVALALPRRLDAR